MIINYKNLFRALTSVHTALYIQSVHKSTYTCHTKSGASVGAQHQLHAYTHSTTTSHQQLSTNLIQHVHSSIYTAIWSGVISLSR